MSPVVEKQPRKRRPDVAVTGAAKSNRRKKAKQETMNPSARFVLEVFDSANLTFVLYLKSPSLDEAKTESETFMYEYMNAIDKSYGLAESFIKTKHIEQNPGAEFDELKTHPNYVEEQAVVSSFDIPHGMSPEEVRGMVTKNPVVHRRAKEAFLWQIRELN